MQTKQFVDLVDEMILRNLDLSAIAEEKQEKLILDIVDNIQQRIYLRVLDELPMEKKEELAARLETLEDNDLINNLLAEYVPNMEALTKEEIEGYKKLVSDFTSES